MKKTFTIILLAMASLPGLAQTWIDLTDEYVINPRYDNNNATGWQGTALGFVNPMQNAEHYNKTYNTYQTLTGLQAGRYRVSLNAFYRMGNSDNDYSLWTSGDYENYQYAKLYATSSVDDYETPIAPSSSAALKSSLGGTAAAVGGEWEWTFNGRQRVNALYIPNNMVAAYYWFQAGYYNNTVECEVGSDGVLTIGIRKNSNLSEDWTCIDTWKLELWSTLVKATSIILSETSLNMVPAEVHDLTATVLPTNATYRNVTWSTTDASVATVDSKGQITAHSDGTCYIVATAKDGSGKTQRCSVTVQSPVPTSENIVINEIMAANVDVYLDPSQNYGSWVELYNPTSTTISLSGLYVTDDPLNLTKHQLLNSYGVLPAHGYALLNFDHHEVWTPYAYRQIDDDLDCDGGTIIISDGTDIIAQEDYPQAISRMSYARTTDGGDTWGTTSNPSPGSSNQANGGFAVNQLEAPVVDKDAQLFEGSIQVCVNIPEGATLKYTTDGTAPTLTNGEESVTGLFYVTGTTCYRFRLFQEGYLPSPVVTRTYIYNTGIYTFPIISVVTDQANIYDTERGVFQQGPYGRPGNGQTSNCNWNMDWDRPVSFEYITTDNECVVSQECDFAMCGGWSRAWTPHSFKLKATKTYDLKNEFAAKFFDEKPYLKVKVLQIRNGGNDVQTGCRVKDVAIQQVVGRSGINVDYQAWEPVHVFLNGYHYAVLNMREPNNKDYAYANYGIDTDEMDQFEMSPDSGYVQMRGTDESFRHLIELSQNAADEETYEEISQLLDIDEYANYMAITLYVGATDWPQNNVKGFRDVNNGKFRFVIFDLDGAFQTSTPFTTFFNKHYYTFDTLHGYDYSLEQSVEGTRRYREIEFVTLFQNMLQNETFRKKFIDSYCIVGGSVFQPERVSSIVSEVRDRLALGRMADYNLNPANSANNVINNFNASYNGNLVNQLKNSSYMQLTSTDRQQANISANVEGAKILYNGMPLPYTEFNGYLFAPVTLKAEAPSGYRFAGWRDMGSGAVSSTLFSQGSSWLYYDGGSLDGEDWTSASYSASDWNEGTGIIGYDYNNMHPDIVTTVDNGNLSCYYFRKNFDLSFTPSDEDEFQLNYTVDDGIVVYVNGTEAGRYNMPSGNVSYSTYASTYANANPDAGTMILPASLFKRGSNTIAVEVHNNASNSTDIMWDASLSLVSLSGNAFVSSDAEYTLPETGTQRLQAIFEPLSDEEMLAEGITPVRINEVSASNSIYVNDYNKKNDWIELYNTTDSELDIAGMYISDKLNNPKKYQVPTSDVTLNTIIPARGYKIIWCDKLENIGSDIHTTFKLSAEGGDVIISTADYSDQLTYTEHLGTQTFGRYPDGGNDVYLMNIPTIGKANQLGSYDELYVKPVEPDTPTDIRSYTKEGGITIAYVDGTVNVKSEDSPISSVGIYSLSGMKMAATPHTRANDHFVSLYAATLPQGVYIARAVTQAGDECHIKFVIK